MNTNGRVIVWFSCGAASASAAKFAVEKYSDVHVVYCNTFPSEHPDNLRFFNDIEKWINKKIEIITSKKYATIEDSFEPRGVGNPGYMSGVAGARCTREMKKIPREDYQLPNDLHIFGLTADEEKRIARFEKSNPDLEVEWILRDNRITKELCFSMLHEAGIKLPAMYSLGFEHNNCIGCVKSSSPKYWDKVRKLFPAIFKNRCEQSRRIGCRLLVYHGERIFLDQLPELNTDQTPEQDIECGVFCVNEVQKLHYGRPFKALLKIEIPVEVRLQILKEVRHCHLNLYNV